MIKRETKETQTKEANMKLGQPVGSIETADSIIGMYKVTGSRRCSYATQTVFVKNGKVSARIFNYYKTLEDLNKSL